MVLDVIMGRKIRVGLTLTPNAVSVLDELATRTDLSRSALVESLVGGQITLSSPASQWRFDLVVDDAGTVSLEVSDARPDADEAAPAIAPAPSSAAASGATVEKAPDADPAAAAKIASLEETVATLRAKLATAAVAAPESSAPATTPAISAPPVTEPHASPLVAALQQQVIDLRAQCADLEAIQADQERELEALRSDLAHSQQMAAIGEFRLNRWRYQTFSR